MSVTADIIAGVEAAILDADELQEFTFSASYQAAATNADYDAVTGKQLNTNPLIPTTVIIPGSKGYELDGESIKITALEGIMLRSWLPGIEPATDDILTVNAGVYAGSYVLKMIDADSIAHWEMALVK